MDKETEQKTDKEQVMDKEQEVKEGNQEGKMGRKDRKDAAKALKIKNEELQKNLEKEKDDYIRLMAEFENFRRRKAAEHLDLINTASEKIILELLPVLDDCERALKALGDSNDVQAAKEGTELIYNKLLNILKAKGLKEIDAAGKPFDTEYMEAIAKFPVQEEEQKGKVFDVTQKGYMLGDKVIRYAKVVVGQ